jgi:hypothetical protein
MTEFKKLVQIELNRLTNKTQPQTYDNAIIYSGDRDKAVAIIMKGFLPNSTIVDIADYRSYMCRNAYAIGGGASKGLEKFPDNVTKFVGNDFKETYRLVVE